jgi:hypothetical protein
MPASVSVKKETFKNKIDDLLFLRSSILMAGSGTERTDSVNISQHAVFEAVNIGVIDKVPMRNTTNTNTCVLSSCCVKCYYKLKPFSMSLCFNLRVKKIFFLLPTLLYFVWTESATKKFLYILREL